MLDGLINEVKAANFILWDSNHALDTLLDLGQNLTQVVPECVRNSGAEDVPIGEETSLFMSVGILEIKSYGVSISSDVEVPQNIVYQSAHDARKRAEECLVQKGDIDLQKAQRNLA